VCPVPLTGGGRSGAASAEPPDGESPSPKGQAQRCVPRRGCSTWNRSQAGCLGDWPPAVTARPAAGRGPKRGAAWQGSNVGTFHVEHRPLPLTPPTGRLPAGLKLSTSAQCFERPVRRTPRSIPARAGLCGKAGLPARSGGLRLSKVAMAALRPKSVPRGTGRACCRPAVTGGWIHSRALFARLRSPPGARGTAEHVPGEGPRPKVLRERTSPLQRARYSTDRKGNRGSRGCGARPVWTPKALAPRRKATRLNFPSPNAGSAGWRAPYQQSSCRADRRGREL
jgi:hypothetical protein